MANVSNKTILCFDSGSYFNFCLKLSDHYKQVLYYVPWDFSGFPKPDKARIGSEWENGKMLNTFDGRNFRMVPDFFEALQDADIIFFTDCYQGSLMEHLRELGYPVCGSGKGQVLELDRWSCKQQFKALGMDVNKMSRVVGITALREYLKKVEDKYIKVSNYRRLVESFHHDNYTMSEVILDKMQHELGITAETIEFIIEDPIEAIVEEGIDCYTVNGEYPTHVIAGTEVKNKSYYGEVLEYKKLTPGVQSTTDSISSLFKKYQYKGFFSTEVRTTKDDKNFLIDMTCRLGYPPSPLYPMMIDNLGEVIWGIANGEMVDIKSSNKCGLFLSILSTNYEATNQPLYFPDKYRDNIFINNCIKVDGKYSALNVSMFPDPEVGSIVTVGNSFEDCKKEMEKIADEVKGYGVKIDKEDIDKAKSEFDKMMGKKQ